MNFHNVTKIIDIFVGSRLRLARNARNMTLAELGQHADLAWQQIQKYETGKNSLNLSRLLHLSSILNYPPTWFIEGAPMEIFNPTSAPVSINKEMADDLSLLNEKEAKKVLSAYFKIENKGERKFILEMMTRMGSTHH